ncbi:hypothetical protein D3C75_1063780 [compost metagenome]
MKKSYSFSYMLISWKILFLQFFVIIPVNLPLPVGRLTLGNLNGSERRYFAGKACLRFYTKNNNVAVKRESGQG